MKHIDRYTTVPTGITNSNVPDTLNNIPEKSMFIPASVPIIKPVAQIPDFFVKPYQVSDRSHTEHTKPQTYDGSSSWTDYKVHFETVS